MNCKLLHEQIRNKKFKLNKTKKKELILKMCEKEKEEANKSECQNNKNKSHMIL